MKHKKEIAKEIAKSTCMENKSMDLSVQMEQMASGWEIPWSSVCLTKRLAAGVRLATYIGLHKKHKHHTSYVWLECGGLDILSLEKMTARYAICAA